MLNTEIQLYYNKKLGLSKLENYSFIRDYGKIDDFNISIDEYVITNIDINNEYYLLSQYIVDNIKQSVLEILGDYDIKKFYEIVLYNIERNINVYEISKEFGITDLEHTLNRLKAIVRLKHQDFYKEMNNISLEIEFRKRPIDSLKDISKENKSIISKILRISKNKYRVFKSK